MKKLYSIFLLLFFANFCYGQKQEKLPEHPWLEIVELNNNDYSDIKKWEKDILISLEGNYKKQDSLELNRIIKKFNSITETISIQFTADSISNFKIRFLNEYVYSTYNKKRVIDNNYYFNNKKEFTKVELYFYPTNQTETDIRKSLESKIARATLNSNFPFYMGEFKRNSIFNTYSSYSNNKYIPLNKEDIAILSEAYKKGFKGNLRRAEAQYKDKVLKNFKKVKISKRYRNLWFVRNPIAVIIFPFLLLLFVLIYSIGKLKKYLSTKIKTGWIQFGLLIFITLIFVDIIIIFTISTFDFLTIPDDYSKVPFVRKDTIFTTVIFSLLSIPILFLFRFIEAKIQEKVNSILQKTVLIFFSTGFLPFTLIFILFLLTSKGANNPQGGYTTLSNIFVFLIVVATLRALVSYFILKERSLIIENEQKISNLKELKAKAELKSLQSHINPHFLYNALNSIAGLVHTSPDKSEKMVLSLSNLFRYSINKKGKQMSTITEEVVMVQNYLAIESERFGERLQVTITVDDEIKDKKIPMFLLQPLIENAIKHGVSKIRTRGEIVLKIEKETNAIVVTVHDNGPDFPEGLVSGYGLQMVYDLLRLCYGDKASLSWENTPEKKISIVIEKE